MKTCIHGKASTVTCPICDECGDCGGLLSQTMFNGTLRCTGWTYIPGAFKHIDFNAERDNVSWRRGGEV